MSHLDTYIAAKAALVARFTPAELYAYQKAARSRLHSARKLLDRRCDEWELRPYEEGRVQAAREAFDALDNAIGYAQEWGVETPPQTLRTRQF